MYKWRADRTCAFATPTLPSMPFRPELMPADLVTAFLHQLADGHDLWSCSLVNRAFNDAATPLLYRSIRTFSPAKVLVSAHRRDRLIHVVEAGRPPLRPPLFDDLEEATIRPLRPQNRRNRYVS